jgi:hypothetical protein
MEPKKKHELRSLYHHWFPNEKVKGLMLDMQKPVPAQLMNINYLQPIISKYNPYLKFFVKDLLHLVEPQIPKGVSENICKLADLVSSPEKFPAESSKIYTIEDCYIEESDIEICENTISSAECTPMETNTVYNKCGMSYGVWKLSSDNYDWSSCPIGVLPWELKSRQLDS